MPIFSDGNYLAYQGCFIDDSDYPDLVNLKSLSSGARPTDCLDVCKDEEFAFASIQLVSNRPIFQDI